MTAAEQLARLQRERMAVEARREKARATAREVAQGVAETVALSEARGTAFDAPPVVRGAREKPYRRQPGLEWLSGKGRLTATQRAAGERYGDCYRRAKHVGSIGSSLDIKPGMQRADGAPIRRLLAQAESTILAEARLERLRSRLGGQAALVSACDLVCGEELTPREAAGGDREAGRLEAVLGVALDLLAGDGLG